MADDMDALETELIDMKIDLGLPATTCPCCGSDKEKLSSQLIQQPISIDDCLPDHLQDCMVVRMVDGQCRLYQSQYYTGQIIQGFGDIEDGESFYEDVLYWLPVDMSNVYAEVEAKLANNELKGAQDAKD